MTVVLVFWHIGYTQLKSEEVLMLGLPRNRKYKYAVKIVNFLAKLENLAQPFQVATHFHPGYRS